MLRFVQAKTKKHLEAIGELFTEYVHSLGFELDFQDYENEFAELPGEYAPPNGCLVLAIVDGDAVGCIGLRKIDDTLCEMKRMYVRPDFRGKGIGRSLAEIVIEEARKIGYKAMRLDTIDTMKEAISLYRSLGFKEIAPYRHNPMDGAMFMELNL
jgi:putative acetyltransferase